MKKITLLLFALTYSITYSQSSKSLNFKEIYGFVSNKEGRLQNVGVLVDGTKKETLTDENGYFKIKVKQGDFIGFSYPGYITKYILIEDVTKKLNINLKNETNVLKEVIVKANKKDERQKYFYRIGRGYVDVRSVNYLPKEKLNKSAISLPEAIRGKIPGLRVVNNRIGFEYVTLRGGRVPIWDLDGAILTSPPNIAIEQVESIVVLRSLTETNAYGSMGANGVIVINTLPDDFQQSQKNTYKKYINKEIYKNDAIAVNDAKVGKPSYIELINNKETAYSQYINVSKKYKHTSNYYFNIVNHLDKNLYDRKTALEVLSDFEKDKETNVEDLKAIAYKYQEFGEDLKALSIFKKVLKLRPNHAQSYRDIANCYLDLNDYKNAWKTYKYYFHKGNKIEANDIGDIFNSEITQTYLKRKKDKNFKEKFLINDPLKVLKADVRIVFEWDTSEAEFEFEFVNPKKQSYKEENSTEKNNNLIISQKTKGYTSKEFMIEDLEKGDWLINYTYLGNKKYKPTFLKITTYYNWGRSNQKKEVNVYEMSLKNVKSTLKKFNRRTI